MFTRSSVISRGGLGPAARVVFGESECLFFSPHTACVDDRLVAWELRFEMKAISVGRLGLTSHDPDGDVLGSLQLLDITFLDSGLPAAGGVV